MKKNKTNNNNSNGFIVKITQKAGLKTNLFEKSNSLYFVKIFKWEKLCPLSESVC